MSSDTLAAASFPQWPVRRAVWFLVAVHLPFAAVPVITTLTRVHGLSAAAIALVVLAAAAACGLQLRHSLAAARGQRPRGWPLSFAALILLADLPFLSSHWYASGWVDLGVQWFVIASSLMLLPRRAGAVVATAATVLAAVPYAVRDTNIGFSDQRAVLFGCYYVIILVMGAAALYGSARLVDVLAEGFAARTELAQQALARERLRLSRDLHDLLGQSLSAVSLKGDLAIALLASDPPAAYREIQSLTGVARSALRDMRAVAWDEHGVSLAAEADAAGAILQAAGLTVTVAVALPGLDPDLDAVLGWAVREGATNILRHSQASRASITASRAGGVLRLEIVNDGAPAPGHGEGTTTGGPASAAGTGLTGLAGRARAAGGTAAGEHTGTGSFRLRVELPEEAQ
jgi:two-component system, NarL family, sensor histidine kinase DesK